MLYLSQVKGQRIWDAFGREVGRCKDVLVGRIDQTFPRVLALAVEDSGKAPEFIPMAQVSSLFPSITLSVAVEKIDPFAPKGDELWLADRILDRQIIDTEGRRVVRVNNVQLARVDDRHALAGRFALTGVDVGGRGLLRRMGLERPATKVAKAAGKPLREDVIPWQDVAPLGHDDPLRLRISRDKISRLPPADIATLLDDLDRHTGEALLSGMENELLADTLAESPAEVQVAVLSHMDPERAADILEEMDPDEAADVLADLPSDTSSNLLELMEEDNAEDVGVLLGYPEDSAGGLMTTEFARVPIGLKAAEALDYLRHSEEAHEDESMHYVYVLEADGRLRHVLTLRDLVLAPTDQPVEAIATPEDAPVTVSPYTAQKDVAYLVAKYNLLAMPVVDETTQAMLGIVTVDDAIDAVLPTAWKKRLPRFS